ncbi:5447_t:CDS:2, partial [Acaulospora morrowiae]
DHGYILSIGMNGITGFLHNKDAKNYEDKFNGGLSLSVGQLLNVSVLSVPDKHRVVHFTADPEIVENSVLSDKALRNVNVLVPGNLVKARVDNVLKNGILCNLNGIGCEIDIFHSGNVLSENQNLNVGDEIRARIIFVSITNEEKKFRLSLAPHILRLEYLENNAFPIGTIFETVTIKRVLRNFGLIMKINDSNITGYTHVSRVSDSRVNSLTDYAIDSTHRARVIGYSAVDGLLLLSLQNSVLSQRYMRYEDVQIGDIVEGTIQKVIDNGIFVTISDNINAFASQIHIDDVVQKYSGHKYKPGQFVRCRVLNVEVNEIEHKINVTLRNSFLDVERPIIKSYQDVEIGMITYGVITGVIGRGCYVSFFGDVHAFVPADQCGDGVSQNLKEHFSVGQIVNCRIKSVVREKKAMLATFRINDPVNTDLSGIKIGELVKGRVMRIKDDIIILSLDPSQIRANLHISHLSDHLSPPHLAKVAKALKQDDVLKNLLVLSKNEDKGYVN